MTLAGRVSAFFLGWLGLSLIGFAVAVFLVVRADLYGRADERILGTLETVVAAIEVDDEGLEWEPQKRAVPRPSDAPDALSWVVTTPHGKVVDFAGNRSATSWLLAETNEPPHRKPVYSTSDPAGMSWRIARRRLDTPNVPAGLPKVRTLASQDLHEVRYASLEVIVAVPLGPIHRELRVLTMWLIGLSAGIWTTAALLGRWLCRRTLAPVAAMAASSRQLGPTSPGERLAVRPTGDELEDLGRGFNAALDRLEEAFERQRRFTGDAAHQLRTPLAAMLGQVEVTLRRERDGDEYRNTLRAVGDEVRHLNRVTEALLFLARADADAALPDLRQINLTEWLTVHLGEWQDRNAGVKLATIVKDSLPVRVHPELLAQLIDNLLDNAVKHGPEAGPVVVRIGSRDGGMELAVEDAGPGISPEDLPHVFDPFFRSPSARAAGVRGVGLGLAVARRIALAMSARLSAESNDGRGSRFVLWFPALSISADSP
jgi:signal transduction histidine kinase